VQLQEECYEPFIFYGVMTLGISFLNKILNKVQQDFISELEAFDQDHNTILLSSISIHFATQ
jgi:hypothetical protein